VASQFVFSLFLITAAVVSFFSSPLLLELPAALDRLIVVFASLCQCAHRLITVFVFFLLLHSHCIGRLLSSRCRGVEVAVASCCSRCSAVAVAVLLLQSFVVPVSVAVVAYCCGPVAGCHGRCCRHCCGVAVAIIVVSVAVVAVASLVVVLAVVCCRGGWLFLS